ncbi:dihydrolipoyllysine-residue acetyltransferase component 5 of pyruvate dehydrogenase complex, chloroplastic [Physcomitrium patens]|uniref:Dihydrolipoamide acetyltransferase component of pyruvate dehydrogenase complex n=1 Tax=Physcomitrium patens TaxID=3218 RepID=A0A2K1JML4_PHYPA|nr:dihydrolipoyllysine-residue acetyltransferase component 5 of pyruvate dehydrogenase complex, chloroplastic-like [Physcomitrium patens]PNR42787.1 hypothetical protein PHYPA_017617 [Physcomitrium patens]|eukprot:XP_024393402.1 dihydrolipoyllysine-residue acetyltransferase component 5 of pyruvate dehydrogenase complex, chloroplastic-like [Physcomitrella patens]
MATSLHLSLAASAPASSLRSSSTFFGSSGVLARRSVLVGTSRRNVNLVVEAKIREIFMPALSSTMTEGKIVAWNKTEGEKLTKGESVVVVESDKADMDVETFYDGFLAKIVIGEGETAPVGAAIGLLAETEEEIAEAKSKGSEQKAPAAAKPSPVEEKVLHPPAPVATPPVAAVQVAPEPAAPEVYRSGRIVATPYAKKLAKQYNIDLATVAGSGPSGRIVAEDVEASAGKAPAPVAASVPSVAQPAAAAAPTPAAPVAPAAAPAPAPAGSVAFTSMQAGVARNMVDSMSVPVFRVGYTVTTDALDALYKKIKSKGVTMTALLAKACALALAKHPVVNACCKDGKSFIYNEDINIAVAVAMDGGLLTPVLKNADKVDIYSLSRSWKELVDKARAKQLSPAEYNSGTFVLSNLGMFGVDRFDAILPPGMGAIMAVGASVPTVVATGNGLFGAKNRMTVNVTADHRIIYGGDLAVFLQTFAAIIENPTELTM